MPCFTRGAVWLVAVLVGMGWVWRRGLKSSAAGPLAAISACGLIVYVLCVNFASTDWVMSLDPKWYSTIFVIVFAAGLSDEWPKLNM